MKTIGIEPLLKWAYCDELPKALPDGPGRSRMFSASAVQASLMELYTVIDANRFGVVPDLSASGAPHPDAVAVHEAVCGLDAMELDLPDDWSPLADLGDLGPEGAAAVGRALMALTVLDAAGQRRLRQTPRRLIERHAILGGCPDTEGEKPERKVVKEFGKAKWFRRVLVEIEGGSIESEVDGFDRKRRRPYPGAYQKHVLDPDPAPVAVARAEYEIWHAALGVLVEDLAGRLADHRVAATDRPQQPWLAGHAGPRILPALRPAPGDRARALVGNL